MNRNGEVLDILQAENAALNTTNEQLRGHITALKQECDQAKTAQIQTETKYQWVYRLLEQLPIAIVLMHGSNHVLEFANASYYQLVGDRDIIGKPLCEALPELESQGFVNLLNGIFQSGEPFSMNEVFAQIDKHGDGVLEDAWHRFGWQPTRDANGEIDGIFYYGINITDQVVARHELEARNIEIERQEEERVILQQDIINAQRDALRELSSPLLPLGDNVVVLPLIGAIDSIRAQQVMETLLEGIAAFQADIAIIDITGVKAVDAQVAQAIVRTAQAVRLLGAQVILTGIQPQIAQTLVHLGADLKDIVTRRTLQAGITYALKQST